MYFVTVCAHHRECVFGDIVDGQIALNEYGKIIETELLNTPSIRPEMQLDTFVIMPNHIHVIVAINTLFDVVGAHGRAPLHRPPKSLGSFVAGFKSICTKHINQIRRTPAIPVWQRNYYEHVVRNEKSLREIREYITHNPLKWDLDRNNPKNIQRRGDS